MTVYVDEPVHRFRRMLMCHLVADAELELYEMEELAGKNLACWCPLDQPCHADVLLELANGQEVRSA